MRPSEIRVFHVAAEDSRKTLSRFLHSALEPIAWNQVRKLIQSNRVQVNGNVCSDDGRHLRQEDVVRVLPHAVAPPPRAEDVKLHYLDEYLVVVEKPSGMTSLREKLDGGSTGQKRDRQKTLHEILPRLIVGDRTGIGRRIKLPKVIPVHRLDRETSGLMVFARTAAAEQHLSSQFRRHSIHRKYLAIAHGDVATQTFESYLVRDRGDGLRGSTSRPGEGDRAVTHVRPLKKLGNYTLIECRLETGRTHQIRIHLAEAGHFLCGDKVYCRPLGRLPLPDTSGAPRLALHASELGFIHPCTGETLEFCTALPQDLGEFMNRLSNGRHSRKR